MFEIKEFIVYLFIYTYSTFLKLHAQLREIIQMLKGQQEVLNIMKQQTDSAVLTSLNDLQGKIDNLQTSLNTLTHQSQSLHLLDSIFENIKIKKFLFSIA